MASYESEFYKRELSGDGSKINFINYPNKIIKQNCSWSGQCESCCLDCGFLLARLASCHHFYC